MIKAIVFDLDDTLFPERDYVLQGFAHVAHLIEDKYGCQDALDIIIDCFDRDKSNVYDRMLAALSIAVDKTFVSVMVHEYREFVRVGLQLYPDVLAAIDRLKADGLRIGLITDGRPDGQNNKIDALGIRQYFDKIIITDELGIEYRKPHKKAFMLMAESLQVSCDEMIYVGDNRTKDFAIAAELPINTVEIMRSDRLYITEEYNKGIKSSQIIDGLDEIIKIIERWQ